MTQLSEAFSTLDEISHLSSSNEKMDRLATQASNEVLRSLLVLAYSPYNQFYINRWQSTVDDCKGHGCSDSRYAQFLTLLVQLSYREVTGNSARDQVSQFLEKCSPTEFRWYTGVLHKDMRIGMAAKAINRAIPNLVPVYDVLLANRVPYDELNLDSKWALRHLPKRIVTQYKIDGYRLNIWVDAQHSVTICTRNGKHVQGYDALEREAAEKLPVGYVYDGEVVDPRLYDWIASNTSSSLTVANRDLFTSVMSHAFSHESNKRGIFNLFDMVPIADWVGHRRTLPYEKRLEIIRNSISRLSLTETVVVPTSRVYDRDKASDRDKIVDSFHDFVSVGWEGLMIKDADSPYEWKRSNGLLKMKMMDTIDLPVTSLFEGSGKYQDSMGGVYVSYKGNEVGVGSGWSDSQRKYYWNHPNELVGSTIEVSYQAETHNSDGEFSLSFPVFKGIRGDK